VAFVGIDVKDNPGAARAFVARYGITYPSLVGQGGMMLALGSVVPPSAVPTTLFLDEQGRVGGRVLGATNATTIIGMMDAVLTRNATPQTGAWTSTPGNT
jgi:hypothetical protein